MHIQISTYLQLLMTALGSYDSSTPLEGGRCNIPGNITKKDAKYEKGACNFHPLIPPAERTPNVRSKP